MNRIVKALAVGVFACLVSTTAVVAQELEHAIADLKKKIHAHINEAEELQSVGKVNAAEKHLLEARELKRRLGELPRDQQVVAYCRGPYCVLAYEAVAELRRQGFDARRMENGMPEWKLAGLPVERGEADA